MNFKKICYRGGESTYFARMNVDGEGFEPSRFCSIWKNGFSPQFLFIFRLSPVAVKAIEILIVSILFS